MRASHVMGALLCCAGLATTEQDRRVGPMNGPMLRPAAKEARVDRRAGASPESTPAPIAPVAPVAPATLHVSQSTPLSRS